MNENVSPIDKANALTPAWMRNIRNYYDLEIKPCAVTERREDGTEIVAPCKREAAEFWTVYGCLRTGGVDAFEDFATEAEAIAFHVRLLSAYPHLMEPWGISEVLP